MIFIGIGIVAVLAVLIYIVTILNRKEDSSALNQSISLGISDGIGKILKELGANNLAQVKEIGEIKKSINEELNRFKQDITKMGDEQIKENKESLLNNFSKLQEQVEKRLEEINGKVEARLSKGFEETNKTFTSIIERLTKIDEAQKKIELLSKDVVSLQDILSDKKSRGTFGEVQLHQILASVFGERNDAIYELQKEIFYPTGEKAGLVDAVLKLPEPTGMLPIDSKFPLENYRRMLDMTLTEDERKESVKKFRNDLKGRIDETSKYIVPGSTSTFAIMFVTAEAVFAEIHAYYSGAVEYAQQNNVFIASPTTLMAVLSTAQAILRDQERSKLAEQIRIYLNELNQEFSRYRTRWDKLSTHIGQVSKDVEEIHITTQKISQKFERISKAELPETETKLLDEA